MYYENKRLSATCVMMQPFGASCATSNECADGGVCSMSYGLEYICLKDIGQTCGANTECANDYLCLGGMCGCDVANYAVVC